MIRRLDEETVCRLAFGVLLLAVCACAGPTQRSNALNSQLEPAPATLACAAAYNKGDLPTAIGEFRPLAEQGDPAAQFNLGLLYALGTGIPRDDIEALKWYRKAADQGYPIAQYCLGAAYRLGLGVPQDDREAATWYRYAGDQGVIEAQYNLGIMSLYGQGIPKNRWSAWGWFRRAALKGHANAQIALAEMYEHGWGVSQDYVQAYFWNSLVLANPSNDGLARSIVQSRLDTVMHEMTLSQFAVAQKAVHEWQSKPK